MRCIFCLCDRPGSLEHVFPAAIGGSLTTERVCTPCNSDLGSRVDSALCDFFPIRNRRAELGLASYGRAPPNRYEMLLGVSNLVEHPGQRVQTTFDESTGQLNHKVLPHAIDVVLPDGRKVRQISVDVQDIAQIPKILQRERKRHGMPPMADEELVAEVARATQNISTTESLSVHMNLKISFAYLRHAMMKIAYELAFLWLGEMYLDDSTAAELRLAVCAPDIASTNKIPGYVGDAASCDAFKIWSADKVHHIAYATAASGGIFMAVRVFDIHAAIVEVTKDAARYFPGFTGGDKLRFLTIEPKSGKMRDVPIMDEWGRIALAMVAQRRDTSA